MSDNRSYYAKVNTASPATGFISVGEVLTEKQAGALGEEKIAELLERGVLGVIEDKPRDMIPVSDPVEDESPAHDETPAETHGAVSDKDDEGDEDEEPVELDIDAIDEIVGDVSPAVEQKPRKPRKGKSK